MSELWLEKLGFAGFRWHPPNSKHSGIVFNLSDIHQKTLHHSSTQLAIHLEPSNADDGTLDFLRKHTDFFSFESYKACIYVEFFLLLMQWHFDKYGIFVCRTQQFSNLKTSIPSSSTKYSVSFCLICLNTLLFPCLQLTQ